MLFPVLVGLPASSAGHPHDALAVPSASLVTDAAAVAVHTTAMLVTMGVVAVMVYEKLGVGVLRRAWLNLDRVWATAVIVAGGVSLFS
jgi:hypothetical protein